MTEILHCGRTVSGGVVGIDIRWDGPLTPRQSVLWSMVVSSDDGTDEIRLSHGRAGDSVQQFVDDLSSGRRRDVEPDADVGDDEVVVRFPTDVVGVAVEWPVWRAVITVDGEDVAAKVVPQS